MGDGFFPSSLSKRLRAVFGGGCCLSSHDRSGLIQITILFRTREGLPREIKIVIEGVPEKDEGETDSKDRLPERSSLEARSQPMVRI
eukprot:scaffold294_cov221-Amphora_coffeaeformis.AAC.62